MLRSFFKDGFDRGERATHIVEADKRADYLRRLAEAGLNVQEMIDGGQLEVLPWTDMYVRDHRFDQDAMLASVEELIQLGASAGYPRTRLVGHAFRRTIARPRASTSSPPARVSISPDADRKTPSPRACHRG